MHHNSFVDFGAVCLLTFSIFTLFFPYTLFFIYFLIRLLPDLSVCAALSSAIAQPACNAVRVINRLPYNRCC